MSKLKVSKDYAIEVLTKRKGELIANPYSFNSSAWKDKTVNDLRNIFDGVDEWIQVSNIKFTSLFSDETGSVVKAGMKHAEDLLDSYIEWINHHASTEDISQYKRLYADLVPKWNALVEKQNQLNIENNNLKLEVDEIKANTIQLESITLKQVWKGLLNLPFLQILGISGSLLGLVGIGFFLGSTYMEVRTDTQIYNLNREKTQWEDSANVQRQKIDALQLQLNASTVKPPSSDTTQKSIAK